MLQVKVVSSKNKIVFLEDFLFLKKASLQWLKQKSHLHEISFGFTILLFLFRGENLNSGDGYQFFVTFIINVKTAKVIRSVRRE